MNRDEIWGLEFDWFATDADGHVALLSTAGTGLVPDPVLQAETELALLEAHFQPKQFLASEWAQYAALGLYVYDCDPPLHGHYRRVADPKTPLRVDDLPPAVARALRLFAFPLRFADHRELSRTDVLPA